MIPRAYERTGHCSHPLPSPCPRRVHGGGRDPCKREGGGRHGPTAETHRPGEYEVPLRADFASFVQRCFRELYPRTQFAPSWHHEIIAAIPGTARKGRPSGEEAVRNCHIRRLIINLPPPSSLQARERSDQANRPSRAAVAREFERNREHTPSSRLVRGALVVNCRDASAGLKPSGSVVSS